MILPRPCFPQGTTSIALHPPSGLLCYTAMAVAGGRSQSEVNCAWMDGRNKVVLWRKSSIPTSLVFSSKGTSIFWADTGEEFKSSFCPPSVSVCLIYLSVCSLSPGEGVISSIGVDGSGFKQYKTGPGLLLSFTHTENVLLWVTLDKGERLLVLGWDHFQELDLLRFSCF